MDMDPTQDEMERERLVARAEQVRNQNRFFLKYFFLYTQ